MWRLYVDRSGTKPSIVVALLVILQVTGLMLLVCAGKGIISVSNFSFRGAIPVSHVYISHTVINVVLISYKNIFKK